MDPDHLHVHVYTSPDPRMDEVLTLLRTTHRLLEELMAKYTDITTLLADLDSDGNRIAALLDQLIAQTRGGLSPTEADEVIAKLTVLRDHHRALGVDPNDPIPPIPA